MGQYEPKGTFSAISLFKFPGVGVGGGGWGGAAFQVKKTHTSI